MSRVRRGAEKCVKVDSSEVATRSVGWRMTGAITLLAVLVVSVGIHACMPGIGTTSARLSDSVSVSSSPFRAMTFGESVELSPGTAKAVRTTDRPQPGEGAARPVATVNDAGELVLDFREVPPGNNNFPDVFRIGNVLDEPLTVSITPRGEIAPLLERVWVLDSESPFDVAPEQTLAVDVKLRVPKGMEPREYSGHLTVGGIFSHDIPVAVTVVESPGSKK